MFWKTVCLAGVVSGGALCCFFGEKGGEGGGGGGGGGGGCSCLCDSTLLLGELLRVKCVTAWLNVINNIVVV